MKRTLTRKLLAAVLGLAPSWASAAAIPVLTEEPANPSAYKRLDVEGWHFLSNTRIGLRHYPNDPFLGPQPSGIDEVTWTHAPTGSASFWLETFDGVIQLRLDDPPGLNFPTIARFGVQLPTQLATWKQLLASDQLSFDVTGHELRYDAPKTGLLRINVLGAGAGREKTDYYIIRFVDNGMIVPEPAGILLAIGSLLMLFVICKR